MADDFAALAVERNAVAELNAELKRCGAERWLRWRLEWAQPSRQFCHHGGGQWRRPVAVFAEFADQVADVTSLLALLSELCDGAGDAAIRECVRRALDPAEKGRAA